MTEKTASFRAISQ